MVKPWVISNFLKEMTDGFYVDVNPINDQDSPTRILSCNYRWRGIAITPSPMEFQRSNMFRNYVINLNSNPKGLVAAIYETHPGTMLHYVCVNNVPNIIEVLNQLYVEDVEKPFSINKVYPHLNIISFEVKGEVTKEFTKQLNDQFDLVYSHTESSSNWYVNEVLSYLV